MAGSPWRKKPISLFEAEMKKIDRNPFKETKTFDLE